MSIGNATEIVKDTLVKTRDERIVWWGSTESPVYQIFWGEEHPEEGPALRYTLTRLVPEVLLLIEDDTTGQTQAMIPASGLRRDDHECLQLLADLVHEVQNRTGSDGNVRQAAMVG